MKNDLQEFKDHVEKLFIRNRDIPADENFSKILHGFREEFRNSTKAQTEYLKLELDNLDKKFEEKLNKAKSDIMNEVEPVVSAYKSGLTLKQIVYQTMKGLTISMGAVIAIKYLWADIKGLFH